MAQTGFTPISLYYTATAAATPTAGNLVAGELAINTADGKLFYKDSAGVVQTIASKSTGTVAGSTTQVIYNNAGAYVGSANLTFNGTTLTAGGLTTTGATSTGTLSASGVATFSAGTVSAAAITTTGDTNTGIYFPAADTIAFTEGGVEALRLNANGQTSTSIAGTASVPSFTRTGDENTGIFFPAADTIAFAEGGTEVMRINSSGQVGIGTNNPVNPLQVAGVIASTSTGTANTGINSALVYYNSSSTYASFASGNSGSGTTFTPIVFEQQNTASLVERMRISGVGNIGIGTDNPAAKLTLFQSGNGYSQVNYGNTAENGDTPWLGTLNNVSPSAAINGWAFYDSNANGNLVLYRRNASTTGNKTAEWNRTNGNFSFDSGYGSAATAYGCRAWVNFNGQGTPAIRASGNVSSITDNGTGDYTLNFTTAMPDANYSIGGYCLASSGGGSAYVVLGNDFPPAAGSCRVGVGDIGSGARDVAFVMFQVFR